MKNIFSDLRKYSHLIVDTGLVVGAGGNISMRKGDYMYISPSGYDLKEVEDEHWVKVHIQTGEVYGQIKPSSELLMHLECYRNRPDITSVLHAHPTYTIAVSVTGRRIPSLFPDFPAMIKSVAYLDYIIPTTDLLSNAIKPMVKNHDVIVMRNHGLLTLGKTMKEAYFYLQLVEESAKIFSIASSLGEVRILSEEEEEALRNLSSEKYRHELLTVEES